MNVTKPGSQYTGTDLAQHTGQPTNESTRTYKPANTNTTHRAGRLIKIKSKSVFLIG